METKKNANKSAKHQSAIKIMFVLCLTMAFALSVALFVSSGANYATAAKDHANARVAAFNVMYEIDDTEILNGATLNAETPEISVPITVYNYDESGRVSEVTIRYRLVVTTNAPLPEGIAVTLKGYTKTPDAQGNVYTFDNIAELEGGKAGSALLELQFAADMDSVAAGTDSTISVSVDVVAEQVD